MAEKETGQGGLWLLIILSLAILASCVAMYVFEIAITAPEGLTLVLFMGSVTVSTKAATLCELCLRNPAGESGVCGHCELKENKRQQKKVIRKRRKQYLDE